jgi:thiol-disulfide isomerase/thioredoxin
MLDLDINIAVAARSPAGSSHHVITVGVEEADQLYVSLNERTNEQHVLMVLYAPWCPYCQAIEPEVSTIQCGMLL